ncbi:hypothetical protein EXW72_08205 [Pseudomonas sp. BCA14]|uniref:hypothetical protein n=1 Tax=unclassified Pseudomonas TaxID=196821 RepID=UPI00106EEE80|nr:MULTISPECIES: hypothetical protein [unclassified Pseudomonas]TFF13749.1 hypothetical protein EXW70_04285 [Pseudomonas sp. JMN1]TFF15568.1 hypothetical protein EXW71_04755 [Pseudomonas sp. BCA17]TFF31975.1 hypothetical protein EXW72_08205 [Pseudomonas sp. BCA14]TFF32928.1 hypothetical protein EXW73_04005 [Pseudomonas sp. BCA13]
MIDFSQVVTVEKKRAEEYRTALETARSRRRAAYQVESDPIRLEIAYDALLKGVAPDFGPWVESVTAIKERYPLPPVPG